MNNILNTELNNILNTELNNILITELREEKFESKPPYD